MTVADVAALGEPALVAIIGRAAGRHLHALAHNRDPRRIDVGRRRRSIGTQRALGRRASPPETLDIDLIALVDRLARRLRKAHRVSRTVTLRLRFRDFSRATRSHTLPEATADTLELLTACRVLLGNALPTIERRGITLIGITFSNLSGDDAVQMPLPFDGLTSTAIDSTLDGIRERFGRKPSRAASSSGAETGCRCPSSPTDTVPTAHGRAPQRHTRWEERMASRFTELVIDSHDPERLAAFWQEVLGCPTMERGSDGGPYVWIGGGGSPVELVFVPVPETKAVKNRIHIDVNPSDWDQAEEVERLLALGARHADVGQGDVSWVVLADPEGNEFCVLSSRVS